MTQREVIEQALRVFDSNMAIADLFLDRPIADLNRAPLYKTWTAAQCLDHLVKSNRPYIERVRAAGASTKPSGGTYSPSLFVRVFTWMAGPKNTWVYVPVPDPFEPGAGPFEASIVEEFRQVQRDWRETIEACRDFDVVKSKLSSPVNDRLKFSIADVLTALPNHDTRHLLQAKRALGID